MTRSTGSPASRTWSISRSYLAQAGLRAHALIVGAQHLEHAAHLGQGGSAGRFDRLQRPLRGRGILVDDSPGAGGLDDHDADVVGDHVVQLPGDAGSLLGHGLGRLLLPLALELHGPVFQLPRVRPAYAQIVAD